MRFRLLQAREPGDQVKAEERAAFAKRLDVDVQAIEPHDLLQGNNSFAAVTEGVDVVLVGGSGAFGMTSKTPWMQGFVDVLGEIADRGFPMFASCFGFQGLVVALGGEVLPDDASSEVGTYTMQLLPRGEVDPLFGLLPSTFNAQLGHKDRAFEFPEHLDNCVSSERCPYQALRVHGKPVYATQFHPELTYEDNKLRFSRYYDMYKKAFGDEEAERMMREGFRPSPEANSMLKMYVDLLRDGKLG